MAGAFFSVFSVFSVVFGGRVLCPANVTFGHEDWRSEAGQWALGVLGLELNLILQ
jgi:hypothetical protein